MSDFGGHSFYDLFLQAWGGGVAWPSRPPLDPVLPYIDRKFSLVYIVTKVLDQLKFRKSVTIVCVGACPAACT